LSTMFPAEAGEPTINGEAIIANAIPARANSLRMEFPSR
jgi:hypothetical protein